MSFSTYTAKSVPHEQTRSFEFPSTAVGFCGLESSFHHDQWECLVKDFHAKLFASQEPIWPDPPHPALQAFCAALSKAWDSGGTYQQHPATTKQTKPFEVPRWSQVIPGDPRWLLGWPTILRYFGSKVKMVKSQFTNLFGVETPWMCSFAENGENGEKEAQDSSPWSLPHREVLNRLSILPSMLVHGLMQPRSSRTWGLWCHVWWRTGGGLETLETSWWILS